jgi:putative toxin-antitoxin system antitoxin component (TIGR02293 family)
MTIPLAVGHSAGDNTPSGRLASEGVPVANRASNGQVAVLVFNGETPQAMHERILEGFPFSVLTRFEKESHLPKDSILTVMHLPERTHARRKDAGRLSSEESERLYRLITLFRSAVGLFNGDRDAATQWLQTPRPALGGQTPLALAQTEVGAKQVETLIRQLEHGVIV